MSELKEADRSLALLYKKLGSAAILEVVLDTFGILTNGAVRQMHTEHCKIFGFLHYALAYHKKSGNHSIRPIHIAEILEYGTINHNIDGTINNYGLWKNDDFGANYGTIALVNHDLQLLLVLGAHHLILVQDPFEDAQSTPIWEEVTNSVQDVRCFALEPGAQSSALDRLLCVGFHTARRAHLVSCRVNYKHKAFRTFCADIQKGHNKGHKMGEALKPLNSLGFLWGCRLPPAPLLTLLKC